MARHIERGEILEGVYTREYDTLQSLLPEGANLLGNVLTFLDIVCVNYKTLIIACHGILHWINFRYY